MLSKVLEKRIKKWPNKHLIWGAPDEITEFDNKLKNQAQRMLFIMYQCEGIGLAANQLGFTNSIFVYTHEGKNNVCINPICTIESGETQKNLKEIKPSPEEKEKVVGIEGCLSVPSEWLYVPRFDKVSMSYQNLSGDHLERTVEGYEARIIQHEVDHLYGRLIRDYRRECNG